MEPAAVSGAVVALRLLQLLAVQRRSAAGVGNMKHHQPDYLSANTWVLIEDKLIRVHT